MECAFNGLRRVMPGYQVIIEMGWRREKYNLSRACRWSIIAEHHRTAAVPAWDTGVARGPRIRASNSAVGQESAGRPYLICIAFTALRLCWPITPSILPTL